MKKKKEKNNIKLNKKKTNCAKVQAHRDLQSRNKNHRQKVATSHATQL